VGTHLIAYNGRDDKIFSGAIMESGNSETSTRDLSHYDPMVSSLAPASLFRQLTDTEVQCSCEFDQLHECGQYSSVPSRSAFQHTQCCDQHNVRFSGEIASAGVDAFRSQEIGYSQVLDGDFIQRFRKTRLAVWSRGFANRIVASVQLSEGAFVHVPIIDGTNSDEGSNVHLLVYNFR